MKDKTPIPMPKGLENFEARLAKRKDPVREEVKALPAPAPGLANLSVEPQPTNNEVLTFNPYPDGMWCKFTSPRDRPNVFVVCMNSATPDKPNMHEISACQNYGLANLLCEAVNLLFAFRLQQQRQRDEAAKQAAEPPPVPEQPAKP